MPGATVIVTNQDTNAATELVTTEAGQFTAPYLPAGTYTVAVTLPGFAAFRRTGIVLATAETVRVDVELKVNQVGESVEVTAEAPLLQTDRTSVSGAIGAEMIDALPNVTQNPLAYAFLQAGAVPRNATNDTQGPNSFGIGVDGRRAWSAVGVNGGRAFTNDIQLDGLPVMGGGYNEASVVPNTEGLQEVRVISNNFSAEYGRGQSVIAMSTKSGTNAFRGQGVYMMRHEGLDANSFSNNAQDIPKREFRVNDAGGTVGGPIIRNKLFFFSSYHGLRNNQNSTQLLTVPTALERVGNFSQTFIRDETGNPVAARIFDPWNVVQEGPDLFRRLEFPNAHHPEPGSVRAADVQLLPAAEPHAGRRVQHEQLRGHDPDDDQAAQLEQPRGFPLRQALDLWQRRHLVRRDRHAAAVRRGAVQRRGRRARRQEPVLPDRGRDRRQLEPGRRSAIRGQPDQHQEPFGKQGRIQRLQHVRRAVEPSAAHPVSGRGAERQPERVWRRPGRRQQLVGDDDGQFQHQA